MWILCACGKAEINIIYLIMNQFHMGWRCISLVIIKHPSVRSYVDHWNVPES